MPCGSTTHAESTVPAPFTDTIPQSSIPPFTPTPLTPAQLKEQIERKKARNAAKIDAKAKANGATDTKTKLRIYTTLLKLKLHIA